MARNRRFVCVHTNFALAKYRPMDSDHKTPTCLICSVPITETHLGIDSCRACSVFYKRICSNNRPPEKCKGGKGKCIDKDATTSCRKCRFDRFSEVMNNALAVNDVTDTIATIAQINCDPNELRRSEERAVQTEFIDHNTFLLYQPSCSDTPLLDQIRWGYSLMCLTRKSGETATKPISHHPSQAEFEGADIVFYPVTYSMIVPNARIFTASLFDFAKMTFPDFAKLETDNRGLCINKCFHQVSLIESTYRSLHHFPNNPDTCFASYTTIMNDEIIGSFLDDCPFETNTKEAIEALKVGMGREKSMMRDFFYRAKPDDVEFLALLGLSFWNTEVAIINEELSAAVEKNRAEIMKEMHCVYKLRGKKDYATRLGELFCLIDNLVENVTLTQHDIEVYRLLNMWNEAFPETSFAKPPRD